jgi:carboxypeptidase-like protein/type IX secretion system substrate protein/von Willebrand factor type A domain-containing protein
MRFFYFALVLLLSSREAAFSQPILIRGKVKNEVDSAMANVTVRVNGAKMITATDGKGEFAITVQKLPVLLLFTALGYESREVILKTKVSSKYISVRLTPSTVALDDVVVIGYSAAKRTGLTFPVTSGGRAGFLRPEGRAAGIGVGSGKVVRIRGTASPDTTGNDSHDAGKPGRSRILTAGELSDFKKWKLWEGYTKEEFKQSSEHWGIAPTERYCVQAQNSDHKGIAGEKVFLIDRDTKDTAWRAVTDNTGKAELWANFDRTAGSQANYELVCGTETIPHPVTFENGINYISLRKDCSLSNSADIAFVVDATGSMGDEIQYLKEELQDVIGGLSARNKGIDLNLGTVFYRDHYDEYLTRHMDFRADLPAITRFITKQSAGGGGDYPEAVDAALTTALDSLHWDAAARAKILFLILDAPPHDEARDRVKTLVIRAAAMGIRIVPIVCSGIDKPTEYLMRSIALATNGSYVFLTDDSGVGDTHIKPTTDNFKVELLNDLLQRVISEMIFMIPCAESEKVEEPVDANDNIARVVVYPNPSAGSINIRSSEKIKELFVADFTGKVLEKVNVSSKTQNWQIDLGRYPSGTYLIEYFTEARRWGAEKVLLLK